MCEALEQANLCRQTGQVVLAEVQQSQGRAVAQELRQRRESVAGEVALGQLKQRAGPERGAGRGGGLGKKRLGELIVRQI